MYCFELENLCKQRKFHLVLLYQVNNDRMTAQIRISLEVTMLTLIRIVYEFVIYSDSRISSIFRKCLMQFIPNSRANDVEKLVLTGILNLYLLFLYNKK